MAYQEKKYDFDAVLKRCIDGDTIELSEIDMGFSVKLEGSKKNPLIFRIDKVDTPELRPRKNDADGNPVPEEERQAEKVAAQAAKAFVEQILAAQGGKIRLVSLEQPAGFNRGLADVELWCDENGEPYTLAMPGKSTRLLSEVLLETGHATPYED